MAIDIESLRRHYASLSDEALDEIDPGDLVPDAHRVLEEEMARRGLSASAGYPEPEPESAAKPREVPGNWPENSTCVISYAKGHGRDAASLAADAATALGAAGIPSEVVEEQGLEDNGYRVMVPVALYLEAQSVLDLAILVPEIEEGLRSHFAGMTDADLRSVDIDAACAGLRERVRRMCQVYDEEMRRRGLKPRR